MMAMLFILLILSMGKVQLTKFNADLELLLDKLFLHLALANSITSNPAKLCS